MLLNHKSCRAIGGFFGGAMMPGGKVRSAKQPGA